MGNMQTPEELRAAFGFLFPGELDELRRLALLLPPDPLVVNIGAGVGTSAATFLHARPDLTVITVDIQEGVSPYGGLGNERVALVEMGLLNERKYFPIVGDSKTIGKTFPERYPHFRADLIFIDGDHTYEGCAGDILAWLPLLKPGGYLAIHDYDKLAHHIQMTGDLSATPEDAKSYPGVDQAVRELLLGKYAQESQIESLGVFRNERIAP